MGLVHSGPSGIMYDFFFYTEATENEKSNGPYVVNRIVGLPKNENYRLYFDHWFCTLDTCIMLKRMGILSTATVRKARMKGFDLPSEHEMKKMGQGTHWYKCDLNSGLVIVPWYDNKCVNASSNYANPEPFSPVKRWDQVNKKHVNINCPVIKDYNNPWVALTLVIC